MNEQCVKTYCRICWAACPVVLTIENGHVKKAEGDGCQLCPMGQSIPQIVHAPDRLLYPLKKEANGFKRISWDEALNFITKKLQELSANGEPQALAIHTGRGVIHYDLRYYIKRFADAYGTPNMFSVGSQCAIGRMLGNGLTFGLVTPAPAADFENTNCVVIWGCNPAASNFHSMRRLQNSIKRGAKIIAIDPRPTGLAKKADIRLMPKPGTDRALALCMLDIIIREKLYDKDFVIRWTTGFDELVESINNLDMEKVRSVTGVPLESIHEAARLYATSGPACIVQGNALELHEDGVQAIRAISILLSICGNLDIPGGSIINPGYMLDELSPDIKMTELKAIGAETYPLFHQYYREGQQNLLADTILEEKPYPIRGMIVTGANPIATSPDTKKIIASLDKLDFLVVMDLFMTGTAEQADIVLPASTFLERVELCDLRNLCPFPRIALIPEVIPTQGESWPDWKFWVELARRMGYKKYFPWKDIKEANALRLGSLGMTIEQLEEKPEGIPWPEKYKKYEEKGFSTPSGKVEIYSKTLEQLGHEPLPAYEIPGSPEHEMILSTGARFNEYIHSRFRNIPSLRNRRPEPLAEISPETARKFGFGDGDIVNIKTQTGELEIKVKTEDGIFPGVVFIPDGWEDTNANLLTDDRHLDNISGFPSYRFIPCSIMKI